MSLQEKCLRYKDLKMPSQENFENVLQETLKMSSLQSFENALQENFENVFATKL